MTPYPKYKPSGIEWIGDIPESWGVKKLKYLLKPIKGALKPGPFGSDLKTSDLSEDGSIKVYTQRNVIDNDFDSGNDYIDDTKFEKLAVFEIEPKDILVSTRGTIGKSAIFPNGKQKGILHPCLIRVQINPNIVINEWVQTYFNESVQFKENVKLNSSSTIIDVIYANTLVDVFIPLPPIAIQQSILNYITSKTSQIDTLITSKQNLIELLKEEKTAIINEAVTKGINPKVKLKPSGIEWIGDIPEHWVIKKLKYLGEAIIGITYSPNDISDKEKGILVLRSSNIQESKLSFIDCVYINKEIPPKLIVVPGDILICARNGSAHLVGKNVCIDKENAGVTFGAFMSVFRTKYWKYISCFLNSGLFKAQSGLFSTSTVNQLTSDTLNNMQIAFPIDTKEQEEIAIYISNQTSKIDHTITRIEKEIELMQEYRTALISEVVTGKVKVV